MSRIVASGKQRVRRDLFREAVVYARWIVADGKRKEAFRGSMVNKKQKVYQAAIQLYMKMEGNEQWLTKQLAVKEVKRAELREGIADMGQGGKREGGCKCE